MTHSRVVILLLKESSGVRVPDSMIWPVAISTQLVEKVGRALAGPRRIGRGGTIVLDEFRRDGAHPEFAGIVTGAESTDIVAGGVGATGGVRRLGAFLLAAPPSPSAPR